ERLTGEGGVFLELSTQVFAGRTSGKMLGQHSNQSPGVLFDWSHEKHLSLRDGDTPCRTTFALAHWSERVVVRLSSSLVQAYCDAARAQRSRRERSEPEP